MKIYIPTLSRAGKISTLKWIPREMLKFVHLVVQKQEHEEYQDKHPDVSKLVLPGDIKTISPTREYIIKNCNEKYIIMMDDDLSFYIRKQEGDWHLRYMKDAEFLLAYKALLWKLIKGYAHVAISAREGNNRHVEEWCYNQRYMRAYAYNTEIVKGLKFNRVECMEDFDIALQLIKKGFPSAINYYYAHGQKDSNASGGCSNWRSREVHNNNAKRLAELHPDCVKIRKKKMKQAWGGGGEILDVIVQWKKAYESSKK